jgi:hypothetical protein
LIKQRIVLILGAGASIPYGFPSGEALRANIIKDLSKSTAQPFQLLEAAGFEAKHITNFRSALQQSGQRSVDAFLEHRSEFVGIGKVAIAAALIPYEVEDKLWDADENWYRYLWHRLGPTLNDVMGSQLRVITFNYERSFEHYFFSALRNSYNISTTQAANVVRDILRVVHVYGKLGPLPWESDANGRSYHPVEPANMRDAALTAAKAIKIVPESDEGDQSFVDARTLLKAAESVIFLGFGYLPKNVERLGIVNLPSGVLLTGTAYGLLEGDCTDALRAVNSRLTLGNRNHGVLEFLRTHRLLPNAL